MGKIDLVIEKIANEFESEPVSSCGKIKIV